MRALLRIVAVSFSVLIAAGCVALHRPSRRVERRALESIDRSRAAHLETREPFALPPAEAEWRREWGLPLPPARGTGDAGAVWRAQTNALHLSLIDALQVAARGNAAYQDLKEAVFRAALALEQEQAGFRNSFETALRLQLSGDEGEADEEPERGTRSSVELGLSRELWQGATFEANLAADMARLLTADRDSSFGIMADVSVSIPLLQNAGSDVALEPLRQAERDTVYAIYELERYKKQLAIRVASQYFSTLQASDQRENALRNYHALTESRRRVERLAEAGRMSGIQVDQARQDELSARERWMRAGYRAEAALDTFKVFVGVPPEMKLSLDEGALARVATTINDTTAEIRTIGAGAVSNANAFAAGEGIAIPVAVTNDAPLRAVTPTEAVTLALENRLDRRTSLGRIEDAVRKVAVAARAVPGGLDLSAGLESGARRTVNNAAQDDAKPDLDEASYRIEMEWDLPWERTDEAAVYRRRRVEHARAVRQCRETEHTIIRQVRDAYRRVLQALESCRIQDEAVQLAERRVSSTELFLAAGRIQVRDVLEARDALLSAQNALTAARIDYTVALLELQRDMGLLWVTDKGICSQYER